MGDADTDDEQSLERALSDDDVWLDCGYSGEKTERSEMFHFDGFWIAVAHRNEAVAFVRQGGRLPRVQPQSAPSGCVAVSYLLRRTKRVLATGGLSACALYLMVKMPAYLLITMLGRLIHSYNVSILPLLVAQSVAHGGCMFWFRQHACGWRPGLGDGLAAAFHLGFSIMLTQVLFYILFPGPLFLAVWLVVPKDENSLFGVMMLVVVVFCFYLLTRIALAIAVAADKQAGALKAVRRSWTLTKEYFWRTFGLVTLPTVGMLLAPHLWGAVARLVLARGLVGVATSCMLELLCLPIMAFITCYYGELQALHEARAQTD